MCWNLYCCMIMLHDVFIDKIKVIQWCKKFVHEGCPKISSCSFKQKNLVQHNSNIYILYSTQRVYILNWQ